MTSYHTTGTVSVTNGSAAVTGSGTDWATALITAGVIYIEGAAYPIASVASNTALTLAMPYAGTTGAGKAYAIDRASVVAEQTVTNANRLAALLEILPTFTGFAKQLFDDPDGSTALSTLGVSAFMKTLLDDASAAAALATLGIPYEVGTWTPTFAGGTTDGTYTYSIQAGFYLKIGRLVWTMFEAACDTVVTAGTGYSVIAGLPFLSDGGNFRGAGSIAGINGAVGVMPANFGSWSFGRPLGTDAVLTYINQSTGLDTNLNQATLIVAGTRFNGTFVYRSAS